jgi:hypothetical protein
VNLLQIIQLGPNGQLIIPQNGQQQLLQSQLSSGGIQLQQANQHNQQQGIQQLQLLHTQHQQQPQQVLMGGGGGNVWWT